MIAGGICLAGQELTGLRTLVPSQATLKGPGMSDIVGGSGPGHRRSGSWAAFAAAAALLAPLLAACGDERAGPEVDRYVTDARLLDGADAGVLHNGFLPAGSADGPAVTLAEAESTVINGGSLQVPITASAPFDRLLIGVSTVDSSSSGAGGPVRGYYEISMPAAATEATVLLTIARALPVASMVFDIAAAAGASQGPASQQVATVIAVGSGEVQVSVSWDADSDVDLHVVDPAGDEIFWNAMTAASGGELDLDSNADCELDYLGNENITFTEAPPGEYTVRVDYYDSCGVDQTNYVVTVQLPGLERQVFEGTFTGDGDQGADGSGELITTFTITG